MDVFLANALSQSWYPRNDQKPREELNHFDAHTPIKPPEIIVLYRLKILDCVKTVIYV